MGLVQKITNYFFEKLEIKSYTTLERSDLKTTLKVQFNPESYSLSYRVKYSPHQGINTEGRQQVYIASNPRVLKLTLIFDATDVSSGLVDRAKSAIPLLQKTTAQDRVNEFLQAAYEVDGDTHEPSHLTLIWGKMTFKGNLESAEVKYTLFDRSGVPLRAEVAAEFTGELDDPTGSKEKNSPDLTHYRQVRSGDTLPSLCQEIYGSPDHYLMVAKHNGLDQFRNLQPGVELNFPPLR